jgi:hypothetical protein
MKSNGVKFLLVAGLSFAAGLGMSIAAGCWQEPSSKASRMLDRAEGVEALSNEATSILRKMGGDDVMALSRSELKLYPNISSLGKSVVAYGDKPGLPRHVRVRVGGHWSTFFFFIFDPAETNRPAPAFGFRQIAPNVFVN